MCWEDEEHSKKAKDRKKEGKRESEREEGREEGKRRKEEKEKEKERKKEGRKEEKKRKKKTTQQPINREARFGREGRTLFRKAGNLRRWWTHVQRPVPKILLSHDSF